jgi:hypothetical protein
MSQTISPVRKMRKVVTGSYFTRSENVYAHSRAVDREEHVWYFSSRYESGFTRSGEVINFSEKDTFQDMMDKILIAEFLYN